jgi:glucosylceramidase
VSLVGVFAFTGLGLCAQTVKLHVSSRAGDRLTAKVDMKFTDSKHTNGATFHINDAIKHQRIVGFGASFLESGLLVLNTLPPEKQEELLKTLFDSKDGIGFSAMKTPLGGTDFQSAGPWFTYDDTPGDIELKHFSVERDFQPNGVGTYILRARRYGNFVLQAPMDYPPDWMLYDVNRHQDIPPKYYPVLAKYFIRYLEEYKKRGITLDYLSLFNEPEIIYTKITYPEINVLLRDFVGPELQKSGLTTKLMISEAPQRIVAYRRYHEILDDPVTRKFVSAVAYHGYGFKDYEKIAELEKKYPEFPFWMDEICHAYEAGYPNEKKLPVYEFDDGDTWGNDIFSDLEAGTSAWIYWNAILDETGGPWATSPIHGNPDPNVEHPLVVVNRGTHKISYTGAYWYLAHFSKFVRPGAVRIETTGIAKGLRVMTFQTPEGGYVAQLQNSRDENADVNLEAQGKTLHLSLPAMSITTARWYSDQN